jgi:hypothetical protein
MPTGAIPVPEAAVTDSICVVRELFRRVARSAVYYVDLGGVQAPPSVVAKSPVQQWLRGVATTSNSWRETMRAYLCASALLLLMGATVHAGPCTNASLFGSYGFQEQGQLPGAGFREFRSVGFITFDGHGNGSRTSTIWYSDFSVADGTINPIAYTVKSDCTFTYTYLDSLETFSGVIVQSGQKLFWLETTGDPMRSGQAEKIRAMQNAQ